jgi:hypothetical protein
MKASVAYASSIGASGGWPEMRIWKKWSMVHKLSNPAASANRAIPLTLGPISEVGPGQEKLVTAMPSFMSPPGDC